MDMPPTWLPELEMQDRGFMNQYHMNKPYHPLMEDFSVDSFSSDSYTETPSFIDQSFQTRGGVEDPTDIKQQTFNYKKSNSINKKFTPNEKSKIKLVPNTPSTFTISFGDIKPKDEILSFGDSYGCNSASTKKVTMTRNPIQVQDHVLAERKRREKLAQRFLSLSSLLPDLKKMDKATVLEDAANYIQELQSRVKELERLSGLKCKNMQESVISTKRPRLSCSDDGDYSSDEANFEENSNSCDPEIEVRTSESSLLVEMYCRKNCISLVKVLNEMQKLGLSVISCSTMPFADTSLLITIVAQKNDDFIMSTTDLVKNLQLAS